MRGCLGWQTSQRPALGPAVADCTWGEMCSLRAVAGRRRACKHVDPGCPVAAVAEREAVAVRSLRGGPRRSQGLRHSESRAPTIRRSSRSTNEVGEVYFHRMSRAPPLRRPPAAGSCWKPLAASRSSGQLRARHPAQFVHKRRARRGPRLHVACAMWLSFQLPAAAGSRSRLHAAGQRPSPGTTLQFLVCGLHVRGQRAVLQHSFAAVGAALVLQAAPRPSPRAPHLTPPPAASPILLGVHTRPCRAQPALVCALAAQRAPPPPAPTPTAVLTRALGLQASAVYP